MFSKRFWKFLGETIARFRPLVAGLNSYEYFTASQSIQVRICAGMKLCSVRHSVDSLLIFSRRSLTALINGGCTELKKDSVSSDGHRTVAKKSSAGGFTFVQGGLALSKLTKLQWFIVFHISIWVGLEHCGVWVRQSLSRGNGLDGHLTNITNKQAGKYKQSMLPIDAILKPVKS